MKNQETFLKTDLMDFGAGDLGFIWESDPVKRKAVAKKILPAFSSKAIRSMDPIVHKYMDMFVSKMKELGRTPDGLLMNDVGAGDTPFQNCPLLISVVASLAGNGHGRGSGL